MITQKQTSFRFNDIEITLYLVEKKKRDISIEY